MVAMSIRGNRGKADAVSALWRAKQLEYTRLRSLMGRHGDFRQVTRDTLDDALDAFGFPFYPTARRPCWNGP